MSILRLKEVLKEKQTSGKDLAERVGVSQPAISDIVKGKSFPRPKVLKEIAEALDVDVRDLFRPTKPSETIHVIRDNKLTTFNSLEEFRAYANKKDE